jgi:hypothetical protein
MNTKWRNMYIVLGTLIVVGIIVFFSYHSFNTPKVVTSSEPIPNELSAEQQLAQYQQVVRQDALLGSIATSTDGKEMIYTNLKYKFSFRYPSNLVNTNSHFGTGEIQLFGNGGKIEIGISKGTLEQEAESASHYSEITEKFIYINKLKVLQKNITYDPNYGKGITFAKAYSIALPSDQTQIFTIIMQRDTNNNFGVLDDIIKSLHEIK